MGKSENDGASGHLFELLDRNIDFIAEKYSRLNAPFPI
jgi:hypothetical protein